MSSEWMKVMLEEIARKRAEAELARTEEQRRADEAAAIRGTRAGEAATRGTRAEEAAAIKGSRAEEAVAIGSHRGVGGENGPDAGG